MAFPKQLFFQQMSHLGPRMANPHNSGSAIRIVLQFCTMKGIRRDMKTILMAFLKETLFRAIWSFWPKNGKFLYLWICSQGFF